MNVDALLQYVLGPAVVATGTWIAARYGAKISARAAEKTARVQEKADAVTGYTQLVKDLRLDIERLRDDLNRVSDRLESVEEERRRDRNRMRHLVAWARVLRDTLIMHKIPVPDPPAGIEFPDLFADPGAAT